ncbi:cyclin y [Anaeramoeba flamelloides]|uniref:Cyclin y n=1 Tax=Anaeramoeba flamelloides TaxID=1746091 RepID=A0ABQ8Z9B7_9EUKA|nr:cyclin y [Anaeramoeba flamelloides]
MDSIIEHKNHKGVRTTKKPPPVSTCTETKVCKKQYFLPIKLFKRNSLNSVKSPKKKTAIKILFKQRFHKLHKKRTFRNSNKKTRKSSDLSKEKKIEENIEEQKPKKKKNKIKKNKKTTNINEKENEKKQITKLDPKTKTKTKTKKKKKKTQQTQPKRTLTGSHGVRSTNSLLDKVPQKKPDYEIMIQCVTSALRLNITNNSEDRSEFEIFDESIHPIFSVLKISKCIPDESFVNNFFSAIFISANLSPEVFIIMLIYIERLIKKTNLNINGFNWRRICLSTLLLASKFWEDIVTWNRDWTEMFPKITIEDINELELVMLNLISFDVSVKFAVYVQYYFALRDLGIGDFPLKPPGEEGKERFENILNQKKWVKKQQLKQMKIYGSDPDLSSKLFTESNLLN